MGSKDLCNGMNLQKKAKGKDLPPSFEKRGAGGELILYFKVGTGCI
ncbi:hypothetical protein [Anaerobacterium chartisolvens]|nr:hypothetical protein [Anaerobacterium chartisolvens]